MQGRQHLRQTAADLRRILKPTHEPEYKPNRAIVANIERLAGGAASIRPEHAAIRGTNSAMKAWETRRVGH